jgi:hypothetical protein
MEDPVATVTFNYLQLIVSGRTPDSYLWGAVFEPRRDTGCPTWNFSNFSRSLKANERLVPQAGEDGFYANIFHIINHCTNSCSDLDNQRVMYYGTEDIWIVS